MLGLSLARWEHFFSASVVKKVSKDWSGIVTRESSSLGPMCPLHREQRHKSFFAKDIQEYIFYEFHGISAFHFLW